MRRRGDGVCRCGTSTKKMGVPLARADADEPFFRELLQDLQLESMPQQ